MAQILLTVPPMVLAVLALIDFRGWLGRRLCRGDIPPEACRPRVERVVRNVTIVLIIIFLAGIALLLGTPR